MRTPFATTNDHQIDATSGRFHLPARLRPQSERYRPACFPTCKPEIHFTCNSSLKHLVSNASFHIDETSLGTLTSEVTNLHLSNQRERQTGHDSHSGELNHAPIHCSARWTPTAIDTSPHKLQALIITPVVDGKAPDGLSITRKMSIAHPPQKVLIE